MGIYFKYTCINETAVPKGKYLRFFFVCENDEEKKQGKQLCHFLFASLFNLNQLLKEVTFFYPLAQQSCGGDIGSVPTYVRTYVRSFVCSPFVIALATSFIIQFRYNFTQVLGMTITRTNLRFSVIGSTSRSQ